MRFTIREIQEITGGDLAVAPLDAYAHSIGLSWDSRSIEPDWTYVAIVGERAAGNDFAAAAMKSGASVAIMSRNPHEEEMRVAEESGAAIVVVDEGEAAIVALSRAWRKRLAAKVVGITGSVGKTTTKGLVRQVLSSRFRTHATQGNYNNQLGAPYTVLSAPQDCEMLVVEMGMDHAGEIARICETVQPHMGVITNIGVSHLEYLGTRKNIAAAKAELIESLPNGGTAFLEAGGEFTGFIEERARIGRRGVHAVHFGGMSFESDVYATDVETDAQSRPAFVLHSRGAEAHVSLGLYGAHNVVNACAAAAVGIACGMTIDEVAKALESAEPERGRAQLLHAECGAVVFDDAYNASPASMKASIEMLAAYDAEGRRIAVLGDMGELGDVSEEGHCLTGRAAADAGIDLLVCVGPQSTAMARGAREAGMPEASVLCAADAQGALQTVLPLVSRGDALLVKASRYMGLDRVVEGVLDA